MPEIRAGYRMSEATPAFIPYPKAPPGAPNVLMIVLDDIGFAQLGCFGSPVRTPHIDGLAAEGLRFNRFHVTSICSSTRAALLSGRNHDAVGVGMTMETPLGFPGYTGRIPKSAALLPRVLRDNGYNTYAVGKWHLCPRGEYSAAGPMTRWPLAMGFERYYGFLGAETNQWAPELCSDNTLIDPPRTPAEGYHLTEDLVDQAIRMLTDQRHAAPGKPFFCYLAPGAAHAPHQVHTEWSDPYRGRFDAGWEEVRRQIFTRQTAEGVVPAGTQLTPRPSWIPEWDTLSDDARRLFARYMEVFAGFVTHTDAQIGRLITFLRDAGVLDDTIVMVLSDNGASAEGSPTGTVNEPSAWLGQPEPIEEAVRRIDEIGGHRAFNHYPWGWAWAGNTPLQLWKRYAWLGGVRTPLVIRWPGRTAGAGDVRPQFCHAVDLYPTLLDVIGLDPPAVVDGVEQMRIDGASLAAALADPGAPDTRPTQYFEMHGSRGIYHEGWKATTNYVSAMFNERKFIPGSTDFDEDRWSLFDLDHDFAEAVDVADEHPERLEELRDMWWSEADRNQVLPLYEGPQSLVALHPAEFEPPAAADYGAGGGPIYEGVLPPMFGGFHVSAEVDVPASPVAEGVICALGDLNDGWAFYVVDGRPIGCLVSSGHTTRVAGPGRLGPGVHQVTLSLRSGSGGGDLVVSIDGADGEPAFHPGVALFPGVSTAGGGMLVGRDRGLAVSDDYEPPFPFTAVLRRVTLRSGAPAARRAPSEVIETATRAD